MRDLVTISRHHAKNQDSKKLNAMVMKYYVLFCLFLFLGTMMNLPWLKYVVSEKFRDGLGVVPILLLANLCVGVYWNLSIWFKLTGQTKFGAMITVVGAVITLVINFIGIPKFGYMACAWATFACYGSMMVISFIWGQKEYPIPYAWKKLLTYIAIVVGLFFLHKGIIYLYSAVWFSLTTGTILFAVFTWFIVLVERKELKKLPVLGNYL